MRRSRLFRSVVVFGSSLGAATVVGTVASTMSSGCDVHDSKHDAGPWGIIDAPAPYDSCVGDANCLDAWWGFIDAAVIDGNWGTIADAPNDAAKAAKGKP